MRILFSLCLSFVAVSALPEEELISYQRTWKSSDGKSLAARLLGVEDGKAALQLESGKISQVPFTRLSQEDQDFLTESGWPLPVRWRGWPDDLQVTLAQIRIKDQGKKDNWFTYHSDHFEVAAEAELGSTCVREICRLLEGVYLLMDRSPWGVLAEPENDRFRIELYQTKQSYVANGGPSDSAGVYLTDRAVFMVPFTSLGIERSSAGWRQSREGSSKTIVHELTHMLMADALPYLPPWLVEGSAEYMELIPLRTSVFRPGSLDKELKKHNDFMIERIVGGQPGRLTEVFDLNLREWQSGGKTSSRSAVTGYYHAGLLLTYYFIHLDGEGDASRLQRYISASHHNRKVMAQFKKDYAAYEKAWEEFAARPEVSEVSPGQYRYPEDLESPKAPEYPFGDYREEDIRFAELDVLLEGQSPEEVLDKVFSRLKEQGIQLRR